MKVVLDTNVLVSALLFSGQASGLVPLWHTRRIQPVACRETIREYSRVLAYPKFRLSAEEIAELLNDEILPFLDVVKASRARLSHPPTDKSDESFLRTALAGKAQALITGDKHLLSLSPHYAFKILNPAEFMKSFDA